MFHRMGVLLTGVMLSGVSLADDPATHDDHTSAPHASEGYVLTDRHADQAAKAFNEASQRMHHDMAIQSSGNVDMDFARGMLAHHRGAVDMARIELEHGSDEQMRTLAREVIDAQQKEIDLLKRWIDEHDEQTSQKTP